MPGHLWRHLLRRGLLALLGVGFAARAAPREQAVSPSPAPPSWSRNLALYEVNLRQYSPSGSFKDFQTHLVRLRDMGVGILWFMPIHPIGDLHRKGTLGSPYSVKDYRGVNPEHGTLDDFKALVRAAHELGMYVIIDWVANHTAWDNPLVAEHPEWFTRDRRGRLVSPVPDWSDVVDLNYEVRAVWDYMIDAMCFWVREADIDGFRCDVAGMVPTEFWKEARQALDALKPVFMLAEWDSPDLHPWFDMTYDWKLYRLFNAIASGQKRPSAIFTHLRRDARRYPPDAYRMRFTSNHDENSWNGTEYERLGDGAEAFAVLTCTLPGMPLIYTGQEAGLDRRLRFFDKDPIVWQPHRMAEVYATLLSLKRRTPALWNGAQGGRFVPLEVDGSREVVAFAREHEEKSVLVVVNLSPRHRRVVVRVRGREGLYTDVSEGSLVPLGPRAELDLGPWGWRVYVGESSKTPGLTTPSSIMN